MTECERLLDEGKIAVEFLKEEQRNDYVISEKMKKVWAVSIDLLQELKKVCDKYGLTFFAIGGTALGAVRHKGFIPWDDDLDVAMPRKDYEKFLEVAKKEFQYPYFFQSPLTDPYFYNRLFVRLRNSNTTGISPYDGCLKCNNGIFIDIFPLDKYEDNLRCNLFVKKSRIQSSVAWNKRHYYAMNKRNFVRKLMYIIAPVVLRGNISDFYKRHEQKCLQFQNTDYRKSGILYESFIGNPKRWVWPNTCFDGVVWMPFEYMRFRLWQGMMKC